MSRIARLIVLSLLVGIGTFALPSPSYADGLETIQGHILSVPGPYAIEVSDDRGFIVNVQLRPGIIVSPPGPLAPGMVVTVLGYSGEQYFAAEEVDTQTTPYYAYPYPYSYVYPYYGVYPYGCRVQHGGHSSGMLHTLRKGH